MKPSHVFQPLHSVFCSVTANTQIYDTVAKVPGVEGLLQVVWIGVARSGAIACGKTVAKAGDDWQTSLWESSNRAKDGEQRNKEEAAIHESIVAMGWD
ncbi:hypothetical protein C7378_3388 [Acidipila rosea]|uniref:Uncharacterized protein n=1 Tax=Acidipila rosea TaxID=768535 RepID=A0A4V2PUH5_9BACT|nr:hypothetical protein C7378_3388 [Acidipila rosea]